MRRHFQEKHVLHKGGIMPQGCAVSGEFVPRQSSVPPGDVVDEDTKTRWTVHQRERRRWK